ncbi:MAG: acyltransferase [Rickettsiaceae bacterium]|nr:acyltransferase [Rickettsiaceae bacterium]
MLKYRKDIDGLRAIAVLAVVLFHAFPKIIKGGFLGVDIFFVISGYLITSIIIKDFNNSSFNIYRFYSRRIKRIFPSLITIISICLIFGWYTLTNDELSHLAKHIKASVLFYINFVLAHESGYFDISTNLKPLMHLWSLAIEEQFYFFWPLLIYFTRKKIGNLISVFSFIILISLIISLNLTYKNSVIAFYYPFVRIGELASGGLLAYIKLQNFQVAKKITKSLNNICCFILYKDKSSHTNTALINAISIIGFLINILCIIFLKNTKHFPGWYVIIPVISTIMIISAGENSYINKKILSNKVMVWIGLISYPLYLWHWPLFAFANILEGEDLTTNTISVILIISMFMSWLTYILIEKPIRYSKSTKIIPLILLSLMSILGISGYYIEKNIDNISRLALEKKVCTEKIWQNSQLIAFQIDCSSFKRIEEQKLRDNFYCLKNEGTPKIAVMGDSHLLPFAYEFMLNEKINTLAISTPLRLPFINYIAFNKLLDTKQQELSQEIPTVTHSYITQKTKDVEYVILANMGPSYFSGKRFVIDDSDKDNFLLAIEPKKDIKELIKNNDEDYLAATINNSKKYYVEGYVEMIKLLASNGKKVIFVIDVPELGFEPKTCINRGINLSTKQIHSCKVARDLVDERQKEYRQLIAEIKRQAPSLLIYDPINVFCDENYCHAKKGNKIYYVDNNHLSIFGSELLIKDFKEWFDKNIAPFESLKDTSKTNENLENL